MTKQNQQQLHKLMVQWNSESQCNAAVISTLWIAGYSAQIEEGIEMNENEMNKMWQVCPDLMNTFENQWGSLKYTDLEENVLFKNHINCPL